MLLQVSHAACPIRVGTSGYSYAEWADAGFYPPGTKAGEMLPLYARQFGITELNFTWYQMPKAPAVERMRRLAPDVMGLWLLESCRREWRERGASVEYDDLLRRAAAIDAEPGLIYPDAPRFLNPPSMLAQIGEQMRETGSALRIHGLPGAAALGTMTIAFPVMLSVLNS